MIKENDGTVQVSINIAREPSTVFETFVGELKTYLYRLGIYFKGAPGEYIMQGSEKIGQITIWEPDKRFIIEWLSSHWQAHDQATEIEVKFESVDSGTRLSFEHRGWGRWLDDHSDILGWFASEVIATLFRAMSPEGFWVRVVASLLPGATRNFGVRLLLQSRWLHDFVFMRTTN